MKHKGIESRTNKWGWIFVSFSIICITFFVFYPTVQSLITSFKSGSGNNLQFSGLDNYRRLIRDATFLKAVKNTLLYLLVQVPVMIVLALIIASVLNDNNLKFNGFFRTAIFLPCVTSLVAYSIIMKSIFADDGIVNQFLMSLHLISDPIQWITHPVWAKVLIIISIT